jgi:hypothetical protein
VNEKILMKIRKEMTKLLGLSYILDVISRIMLKKKLNKKIIMKIFEVFLLKLLLIFPKSIIFYLKSPY